MGKPIRDSESMSEEPQSFTPPAWEAFGEPCPHCGGTEFLSHELQEYIVKCDDDGIPEEFVPKAETLETLRVYCRECDELLTEP